MADARMRGVAGNLRGASEPSSDQVKGGARIETLWARLRQLLPNAKGGPASRAISQGYDVSIINTGDLEQAIRKALPNAAPYLKRSGPGDDIDFRAIRKDAYYGLTKNAQLIDPRTIQQLASWSIGDQTYCLIESFLDYGESSRYWLYLLHGSGTKRAVLDDFTHRLRYRVGKSSSGLDESGNIDITREIASTMGFGGWPGSVDKVSIAHDRYLIATGQWTINSRRWVLLYDLKTDEIQFFNRDIPEGATLAELAITDNGHTIVQAHANGHLYFYDVPTGTLVLRGFDIDDELIVYDTHGYYAATPEGAHFVFLKFPGLPGYNSFRQFATTLSRPDLIEGILAGRIETPDPQLTSPPSISMEVEEVAANADKRSVNLGWPLLHPPGSRECEFSSMVALPSIIPSRDRMPNWISLSTFCRNRGGSPLSRPIAQDMRAFRRSRGWRVPAARNRAASLLLRSGPTTITMPTLGAFRSPQPTLRISGRWSRTLIARIM